MRKFIIKLAKGVLITAAIAFLIQILINWRIKDKTVNGHDNLNLIRGKKEDIVFLGSSRCLCHFDPRLFEATLGLSAINLGLDGHSDLAAQTLRLKDYLAKNTPPKFVIMNFDPQISDGSFTSNNNFVHKNCFARYAYSPSLTNLPFVKYFGFDFAERNIPLYALLKYKQFFDCLTLSNVDNSAIYGYEKHDEAWDTLSHPINKRIMTDYFDTSSANLDRIKERLNEINQICDQNNIRLICVQTPVYMEVAKATQFKLTDSMCNDLKIPFFDLNCDSIDNDLSCFYNVNHLNTKGVKKMTNMLVSNAGFIQLLGRPGVRN
jgi:hypothetical protein